MRRRRVEPYLSNKFAFLRFNFSTGDAAGQNMVGKATYAAYQWTLANNRTVRRAYLESNFATDKKPSHVNAPLPAARPRGRALPGVVPPYRPTVSPILSAAYSASAVIVKLGLTPGLAGTIDPSTTNSPG